jgi:hypothetical protein
MFGLIIYILPLTLHILMTAVIVNILNAACCLLAVDRKCVLQNTHP